MRRTLPLSPCARTAALSGEERDKEQTSGLRRGLALMLYYHQVKQTAVCEIKIHLKKEKKKRKKIYLRSKWSLEVHGGVFLFVLLQVVEMFEILRSNNESQMSQTDSYDEEEGGRGRGSG